MSPIDKPQDSYRGTKPETWYALDRQGREVMPAAGENGRLVGMFYWTWHGSLNDRHDFDGPHDVSKILSLSPGALDEPDNPAWGGLNGPAHHWSEPMFGYYLNDDPYVIRRHCQMLTDALVDFIAFDASNFRTELKDGEHPGYFRQATEFLLKTYLEIRQEGRRTPQVTFLCPFFTDDPTCVRTMYDDFYSHPEYAGLWLRDQGKPLLLFDPAKVRDEELLDFFSFRKNMPDYHMGPTGTDQWPWLENYPQHAFYSSRNPSRPEIVSVGVAQNSVINPDGGWRLGSLSERDEAGRFIARGRSFHKGLQPQPGEPQFQPEQGYNFAEQWQRAFELDPEIVFVTGWNEWIMGRWDKFIHYENAAGIFVDQFNQEFSRDIEPMRGGHLDDYYYQLVSSVRQYKGLAARPEPVAAKAGLSLEDFSAWQTVDTVYFDDAGDAAGRLHPGFGEAGPYHVPCGRHDFIEARVAHDANDFWFYIRTAEPIKRYLCSLGAWMQLLVRIDGLEAPDWEGFHFTVNRHLQDQTHSWLERSTGGWQWERVAHVDLRVEGCELMLRIPRGLLDQADKPPRICFKWIDSMRPDQDILQLYTHGDTAPNGRFAYTYLPG